jgi:hypothetical protein
MLREAGRSVKLRLLGKASGGYLINTPTAFADLR